jgi:hypothetical protein
METSPTQRRPFRFGLRKLMIWTAVWSVYLGWVRSLHESADDKVLLTVYCGAFLAIRIKWGWKPGYKIAAIAGGLYHVLLEQFYMYWKISPPVIIPPVAILLLFPLSMIIAFVQFLIVHGVVTAVNWLDNLMETKPPQDE